MSPNPLNRAKEAARNRVLGQVTPSQTPIGQELAGVVADIEHRQAAAIQRAINAAGLDIPHGHDPQQRRDMVLNVADAVAEQDFAGWWWGTVAPELMDAPETAREYAGIDGDQWREELERWYHRYHDAGLVKEPLKEADRGRLAWVANRHTQQKFGLSLREFVALVVNWDQGEQAKRVLAGPILQHTEIIHQLADELERKQRRIDELESR